MLAAHDEDDGGVGVGSASNFPDAKKEPEKKEEGRLLGLIHTSGETKNKQKKTQIVLPNESFSSSIIFRRRLPARHTLVKEKK